MFSKSDRLEIHSMVSSYVSSRIVQELIKSPSKATLGGQRKELAMLFADLVGFTTFSEHRPAEEVVDQLNEYLSAMTDVILAVKGLATSSLNGLVAEVARSAKSEAVWLSINTL